MASISPLIRITLGLLMMTVSLLLVGDLLGLIPDKQQNLYQSRKIIAETLVIQVSVDVAADHIEEAEKAMRLLQRRNQDIESIALRSADDRLIFAVGNYDATWAKANEQPSYQHQLVPIYNKERLWGVLEVRFKAAENAWGGLLFRGQTIFGIILFISVAGYFVYWLFLKRVLKELDPTSVVPERVKKALDTLSEGLVILDQTGHILFTNSTFIGTTGLSENSLTGISLSSLTWETPDDLVLQPFAFPWEFLLREKTDVGTTPIKFVAATKERLSFSVNVSRIDDSTGALQGAIVTFSDLTELEQSHRDLTELHRELKLSQQEVATQNVELKKLAFYDPLTGVLNRRSLFGRIETLVKDVAQGGDIFSIIMVDIDHFKRINDRYGHASGDKAIQMMAQTLRKMTRPEDLVSRYGGEEFVVVLCGMAKELALDVTERIRLAVADIKIEEEAAVITFTSSFGIYTYESGDVTPEAIVDQADQALYVAKETGRNKVVHWLDMDNQQDNSSTQESQPDNPAAEDIAENAIPDNKQQKLMLARINELEQQLNSEDSQKLAATDQGDDASRSRFLDLINQGIARIDGNRHRVALLLMGTETITQVRSTLGYPAAEQLTGLTIERLRQSIRSSDTISGDEYSLAEINISILSQNEFAVLLTDIQSDSDITQIVQRVDTAFKEPLILQGNEILIVPKFGISGFSDDSKDPEVLLANASAALLEAQLSERDNCVHFSREIHERYRRQLDLSTDLKKAIEHDGLFLNYMPQIDINSSRITGFEAQLHWCHPTLGVIAPESISTLAQHYHLNNDISRWILAVACNQLKEWQRVSEQQELTITLNFSLSQFREISLVQDIVNALNTAGIAPRRLVIDLKETSLINNDPQLVKTLTSLKNEGINFSLDDFGSGYSSLTTLRDYVVDWVKIDRSFISGVDYNCQDTEIVATVITMAHSLGMKVVATGVANMNQLATLRKLNCDEVQGEMFCEPLLKDQATGYLADNGVVKLVNQLGIDTDASEERGLEGVLNNIGDTGYAN